MALKLLLCSYRCARGLRLGISGLAAHVPLLVVDIVLIPFGPNRELLLLGLNQRHTCGPKVVQILQSSQYVTRKLVHDWARRERERQTDC